MRILVLCTGNSCRSQMAEGFLRARLRDSDHVVSAGLEPQGVNPRAVKVMSEVGIDLSGHTSSHVDDYLDRQFDYIITVCDNAAANCPVFPGGGTRLHWPFDDPAQATGNDEEIVDVFRRVRDEIEAKVKDWIKELRSTK